MPNFFQKLTGSFKMPEGITTEETRKPNAIIASQKTEDAADDQTQLPPPEPEEEEALDDLAGTGGLPLEDEVSLEELREEEEESGEDAQTVSNKGLNFAQLAKAQTISRKRQLVTKKFPRLLLRREEETVTSKMPEGQLAIDVYETPTEIVIKSTIAGVKPEDLDVGIEDNTINIRGSRHNEEKVKGEDYFYQECYWGTFSRSVILPVEIDNEKVQAGLKDGILTIRLPKIIKEKEKKIKVLG